MKRNNKKYLIIGIIAILLLTASVFFFINRGNLEKDVLNRTYDLSKKYISLRYRTDNILLQAKNYTDFKTWNSDMTNLIEEWEDFENKVKSLEESANKLSETKEISFNLIENVYAYDKSEITRVFDKAPAGKKIATLAKHLGVDVKKTYAILKQDQDQVTADAWNEAGDTFSNLETSATVIKDGCKVAGFVGGVILTGGTAGLATATTLTKATVVITGADLALEVTEDAANITFGDNNGVSAITRNIRTVTEPVANILAINKVAGNLGDISDKVDAVLLGIEKFNEAAQEGKILGIKLIPGKKFKINTSLLMKYKEPVYVSELKSTEVNTWLEEQKIEYKNPTKEEMEEILGINEEKISDDKKEKNDNENKNASVIGVWEGIAKWTSGENKSEEQETIVFEFLKNGKINKINTNLEFNTWEQDGDVVRVYEAEKELGYHEFKKEENKMIFIKIAGPDEEGDWSEVYAGEDFFGGKYITLTLHKQN